MSTLSSFQRRILRRLGFMAPKPIPPRYQSYVGPPENFELMGEIQFEHLKHWGLAANHYLLDIGCGCLRGGRFAIELLEPEHYFGIDPNQWLIDDGIKQLLGNQVFQLKRPAFNNNGDFNLDVFGRKFDFLMAQSIFFAHFASADAQSYHRGDESDAREIDLPRDL